MGPPTPAPSRPGCLTGRQAFPPRMRGALPMLASRAQNADGEGDMLAKIAEMPDADRAMAERLHAIVKASAPALASRTWYAMPAYTKDGKARIGALVKQAVN